VAAVDIPLIHLSVQWWRSQHPKPVVMRPEGAQADPAILQTLFVCLFAFTFLFFSLLLIRYGMERLQQRVHALRAAPR
jgi:heme exporter protein C